ncbi:MAG TPA: ABC transporter ATP-binding protein [Bacteroidales bacterium]|nr:ABC transporter ATP-binding protein [Bacteroidales bacterium]
MKDSGKIISLNSLEIGYGSGSGKNILLPPLTAGASKGELVAIIGRNGIGKSTLLRTMAGIQEQRGGAVICMDKNISDYSPKDLSLISGFISTEPVRVSSMRVYDLVSMGRYPHTSLLGSMSPGDHDAVGAALDMASIRYCSGKFVAELSDGERQKAGIARLLAQDTGIMLMDEPTAFLDIRSKFEVFHLMYRLCHEQGKTIVYTSHDLNMASRYSDKIWLLLDTGLVQGSPEDLMINGDFEYLFESSSVVFNSGDGTWTFMEETKGNVHVDGSGKLQHWTGEALKRAGFSLSDEMTGINIEIKPGPVWVLYTGEKISEHLTIYDLVMELGKV